MKKIIFFILLIWPSVFMAQVQISDEYLVTYRKLHNEKIFIHTATNQLFTGDKFKFKLYCINDKSLRLSDLSKIVYIELIGSNKEALFSQKLRLINGISTGDFVIPTNLPSGSYQLIAYTSWMRNKGDTSFDKLNLVIINPANKGEVISVDNRSLDNQGVNNERILKSDIISLNTDASIYPPRTKVQLKLSSLKGQDGYGKYSLTIHKKLPELLRSRHTSASFLNNMEPATSIKFTNNNLVYLPEHLGELITGNVIDLKTNKVVKNAKIALSIPGKQPTFKISSTNDLGIFYFDLDFDYEQKEAVIQVIGEGRENYDLNVYDSPKFNYQNLTFQPLNIHEVDSVWMRQKHIQLQIENAFVNQKKDSANLPKLPPPIYTADYTFNLDEFTRFPTVKETMVEVIGHVWIKKRKKKNYFYVNIYNSKKNAKLLPLILMDGTLIQAHQELYDYDPKKIKTIKIITENFSYGNTLFGGVMIIETFDGNYQSPQNGSFLTQTKLKQPELEKVYYQQAYESNDYDRIPDYRNQLIWEPNIDLTSSTKNISFFTADTKGIFEINLEGFTRAGKPVSIRKYIEVK